MTTPMPIRDVEFIGLRSDLPKPAVFAWGGASARNVGLIRVTTEDGLVGYGETSVTFPLWSLEERALTVREGLRPLVLGADAADITGLVERLNATLGRLGPLWSPVAVQAAIGGFEVALWDIVARAAGLPLFKVLRALPALTAEMLMATLIEREQFALSSRVRRDDSRLRTLAEEADHARAAHERFREMEDQALLYQRRSRPLEGDYHEPVLPIPIYAVGFGGTQDEIAEQAAAHLAQGWPAVKVRVGFGWERDRALLDALKARVPKMDRVLVDANMAWSRAEARLLAPLVGGYGVGWLEEPVAWNNYKGLVEMQHIAGVPIAAGENAYGLADALWLVATGAADVVMPDIARCGGIGNARAMIAAARAKGRPYSPHQFASDVGFATCLHLCAAEPGFLHVLRDVSEWPLRHEVLSTPLRIEPGKAWLPEGPGLGVEIGEETLERYRIV